MWIQKQLQFNVAKWKLEKWREWKAFLQYSVSGIIKDWCAHGVALHESQHAREAHDARIAKSYFLEIDE